MRNTSVTHKHYMIMTSVLLLYCYFVSKSWGFKPMLNHSIYAVMHHTVTLSLLIYIYLLFICF